MTSEEGKLVSSPFLQPCWLPELGLAVSGPRILCWTRGHLPAQGPLEDSWARGSERKKVCRFSEVGAELSLELGLSALLDSSGGEIEGLGCGNTAVTQVSASLGVK